MQNRVFALNWRLLVEGKTLAGSITGCLFSCPLSSRAGAAPELNEPAHAFDRKVRGRPCTAAICAPVPKDQTGSRQCRTERAFFARFTDKE
jgi:hypothetical protein